MNSKDVEMAEIEKLNIITDKDDPHLNATYSFHGEDHTLGNLLRNILMKDADIQFCGYSVPHPSEEIMNVRIQTFSTHTDKVVNKGLVKITKICDILSEKFQNALINFKNK